MNFDTKYLIRWGIPGWMFIFWLFLYFLFADYSFINKFLEVNRFDKLIGIFISLSVSGVVIGYIIHHLYFFINWITVNKRGFDPTVKMLDGFQKPRNWGKNNKKDYFYLESVWHRELLNIENESIRNYIVERYRYLLSTIHGLGTIVCSHFFILILTLSLAIHKFGHVTEMPLSLIAFNIIQLIIAIVVLINFIYYSSNLNYFQGYFLNKMINEKLTNE